MNNSSNGKQTTSTIINVARDFSRFPAGRKLNEGKFSGERFRKEFLVEALKHGGIVTVELDGAAGYGPSFLDEAFGGLVRMNNFDKKYLKDHLRISTSRQNRISMIWDVISSATA